MKMKIDDGKIIIIEADSTQYAIIKSWSMTRYNKSCHWIEGVLTADLLNKLAELVRLPAPIEAERQRMNAVQAAVDEQRMQEEPVPIYKYPVKIPLFKHQIRGANMALLTFGLIEPERAKA